MISKLSMRGWNGTKWSEVHDPEIWVRTLHARTSEKLNVSNVLENERKNNVLQVIVVYRMTTGPSPVAINPIAPKVRVDGASGNPQTGFPNNPLGTGHMGLDLMGRVIMSFKSGIDSEIEWALTSISQQSYIAPQSVNFERMDYVGQVLIKFFYEPFQLIKSKQYNLIDDEKFNTSLNALLTLRNLAQELDNQQWLSQIPEFKQYMIDVLTFLNDYFFTTGYSNYKLSQFDNSFTEAFTQIIDILECLSCYYIDNTTRDPLFKLCLELSTKVNDKYTFTGLLNSLTHLLFTRPSDPSTNDDKKGNNSTPAPPPTTNNCINLITEDHLEVFTNQLLVNDNKLTLSVLAFLKQYLLSQSLHLEVSPTSSSAVKDSQLLRLLTLLQIKSSKHGLHTLLKQLPVLLLSGVHLTDLSQISSTIIQELSKRTDYVSVPSETPQLPEELYKIIINFPEPLRATTWLRCCYEPFFNSKLENEDSEDSKATNSQANAVIAGEVTQISLWKAYERQFESVFKDAKDGNCPSLLPAVDFIKNVSAAFPNSEAMVVVLKNVEPPKKKFIIRGIQPRQFVVGIDVANYDALKRKPSNPVSQFNEGPQPHLPIGYIDQEKFHNSINQVSQQLTQERSLGQQLNKINALSKELIDYILNEMLKLGNYNDYINIFRLYNKHWLPEVVYANPYLMESDLIDNNWIKYLI